MPAEDKNEAGSESGPKSGPKSESGVAEGLPEGVPPPPPPKPDIVDQKRQGPTYGAGSEGGRKRKRRKKAGRGLSHPTDLHHMGSSRFSRRGCCACLGVVAVGFVLLAALVFAAVVWFGPGRYATSEGYRVVNFEEEEAIITVAPDEPTFYMGRYIIYEAPLTKVPVAFFGMEVVLNGDFWEDAAATATRVVGGPTARFAKDLEVYAFEFEDQGVTVRGKVRGAVVKNAP